MYAELSEVLGREEECIAYSLYALETQFIFSFSATDEEYEMFHAIIDLVPTFEPVLLRFVEDPTLLAEFITKVSYYMLLK